MLYTEAVGPQPPRFVFLHGLFGRGRNWSTIAHRLASMGHGSLVVDLPDHGRSDWMDAFSYDAYAGALSYELATRLGSHRVILVGHSMGGKVAMLAALAHPAWLDGLVVIDIAPASSRHAVDFKPYLDAMNALDLGALGSRADAGHAMRATVPDEPTRAFLLQNLHAVPRWHWQANLAGLGRSLEAIDGWPAVQGRYDGPVLWLIGADSPFVSDADLPAMRALFPQVRRETVPHAGHWVHADQPDAVLDALTAFADALSPPSPT